MTLFIILIALVLLLYSLLVGRFIYGWIRIPVFLSHERYPDIKVSLVIPFRNEEKILGRTIKSILAQDYPSGLLEVIYVNDHSEDKSVTVAESLIKNHKNFHLVHLGDRVFGKKSAIVRGASAARGELILFTDADCFPVKSWVRNMAAIYLEKNPVMISGPVLIKQEAGFFHTFQSLEYISLTGSGAGSFGNGDPVLCSGANLGFNRKKYLQFIHQINKEVPSGDDIFMMLGMKKIFPGELVFIKTPKAAVYTEPVNTITTFIMQRIRWSSKVKYYNDGGILYTASIVLLMNLLLVTLFFCAWCGKLYVVLFGIVFIVKSLPDFILLSLTAGFFREKKLLAWFFPVQVIYPFYSVFSGIAGVFFKTSWKGRYR